ncbi:hypothetical protein JXB27_00225 [Candidatus Woesearchaeota archaeon]|nr:hypothetical protein [Candidatus Woesearchaeota archaeon]
MWPFKKKEDELAAFERELGLKSRDTALPETPPERSYEMPKEEDITERRNLYNSQKEEEQKTVQQMQLPDNAQIISAKLDTIKAMLDLINQRINALEKNVEEINKPKKMW